MLKLINTTVIYHFLSPVDKLILSQKNYYYVVNKFYILRENYVDFGEISTTELTKLH